MNIHILHKKTKLQNFYKDTLAEYEKRLKAYCKLKYINSYNNSCNSYYTVLINLNKQNDKPLEFTSIEFSNYLVNLGVQGQSDILFIIGKDFTNIHNIKINDIISLSYLDLNQTLTHIVLLEQIYRSYRIINNEPYHK